MQGEVAQFTGSRGRKRPLAEPGPRASIESGCRGALGGSLGRRRLHILRARLIGWLAFAALSLSVLAAQAAAPPAVELAVMDAPVGTRLDDIL